MGKYRNISLELYMAKLNHLVKTFCEKDFKNDDEKRGYLIDIKNRAKDIIQVCELMLDKLDH